MIRPAVEGDRMRVLAMARAFHHESGTPLPFSGAMADAQFRLSLEDADRFCIVLDVAGEARGVLAAQAGVHHFSPVKVATEILWWVEPAYRGRSMPMLAAYETWTRERGCAFAAMVGLGTDPAVASIYQRRGFAPAERHFLKKL